MTDQPKITVIVSCYNQADYVAACLESIYDQSHRAIELLIYDDGSTDGSTARLTALAARSPFSQTQLITGPNRGVVPVRNAGIARATGDFLLFIDGDDYLPADYVATLLSALTAADADIAYCQLWDFNHQKPFIARPAYDLGEELVNNKISATSLIRTSLAQQARFDIKLNRGLFEDWDFFLNLILNHDAKPVYTADTQLNYRIGGPSRNANEQKKILQRQETRFKKYYFRYRLYKKYSRKIPEPAYRYMLGAIPASSRLLLRFFRHF